jgi:hypothetical protein
VSDQPPSPLLSAPQPFILNQPRRRPVRPAGTAADDGIDKSQLARIGFVFRNRRCPEREMKRIPCWQGIEQGIFLNSTFFSNGYAR